MRAVQYKYIEPYNLVQDVEESVLHSQADPFEWPCKNQWESWARINSRPQAGCQTSVPGEKAEGVVQIPLCLAEKGGQLFSVESVKHMAEGRGLARGKEVGAKSSDGTGKLGRTEADTESN